MLTIRLSRIGKKNKPVYRLIISEKARDTYGRALEILGSYNPHTKVLEVKADRIKYWISQGSGMSPVVNNMLISKGIIKGKKIKATKLSKKKREKEKENKEKESKEKVKEENKDEDKNKDTANKKDNQNNEKENQKKLKKKKQNKKRKKRKVKTATNYKIFNFQ